MFELLAVGHTGLTVEAIAHLPGDIADARPTLMSWVDAGARHPVRIATSTDVEVLRRLQRELAFAGLRTLIAERGTAARPGGERPFISTPRPERLERGSASGQHSAVVPRPGSSASMVIPPGHSASRSQSRIALDDARERHDDDDASSEMQAFRDFAREMDAGRSTAQYVIASSTRFRPVQVAVIVGLAILGALVAWVLQRS
ncbi:MAG: hypothetical protein H6698_06315 [Myxococcales bacterium]|nr:hypothetical protein [Myxococcales bacterium]MCB9533921.1 hypothetical protein [Myxococcales bacterium]